MAGETQSKEWGQKPAGHTQDDRCLLPHPSQRKTSRDAAAEDQRLSRAEIVWKTRQGQTEPKWVTSEGQERQLVATSQQADNMNVVNTNSDVSMDSEVRY